MTKHKKIYDTLELISAKRLNRTINISPYEIFNNWASGDYWMDNCPCPDFYDFDQCINKQDALRNMLEICRGDDHYIDLFLEIRTKGFKVPIAAQRTKDKQNIVLIDGHHRLAVAIDLNISSIPVYIANEKMHVYDLVAVDSIDWVPGTYYGPPVLDSLI